jgi:hypothetical protein
LVACLGAHKVCTYYTQYTHEVSWCQAIAGRLAAPAKRLPYSQLAPGRRVRGLPAVVAPTGCRPVGSCVSAREHPRLPGRERLRFLYSAFPALERGVGVCRPNVVVTAEVVNGCARES